MTGGPRFTVVVPMLNESGNIGMLVREIAEACTPLGRFEAIFVNDGSTDTTAEVIAAHRATYPWLREVRHAQTCGQSAALRSGVLAALSPVICTIDGDGQNPPAEIPKLLAPMLTPPALEQTLPGLVAGQRTGRQDTASRRLASWFANGLRATLLNDHTRDTGCGLKAFPRDVFLALPFFDHMHRFLPALVRREGHRVELVDVSHRARHAGTSKYTNIGRGFVGMRDLMGVWWLLHRRRLPHITHEDR